MKDIYKILIENLTNERLDEIAFQDENFCTLDEELDETLANYNKLSLSDHAIKDINRIFDLYGAHSARYASLAYQQGIKDSVQLLKAIGII